MFINEGLQKHSPAVNQMYIFLLYYSIAHLQETENHFALTILPNLPSLSCTNFGSTF